MQFLSLYFVVCKIRFFLIIFISQIELTVNIQLQHFIYIYKRIKEEM